MYFDSINSAKRNYGNQTKRILTTLIQRFIGANPEIPYRPVLDFPEQTPYDEKGWCHVLDHQFLELEIGKKVLATTYWPANSNRTGNLVFKVTGPTSIYVNDDQVFTTTPGQENMRQEFSVHSPLQKGWNKLSVVTEKTPLGLGFQVRSSSPKWDPVHFYRTADYFLPVLGFSSKEYQGDLEAPAFQPQKEKVAAERETTFLIKAVIPSEAVSFTYEGDGNLYYKGELVRSKQVIQISGAVDWLDLKYTGKQLTGDLETFHWDNGLPCEWIYCGPVEDRDLNTYDFSCLQTGEDQTLIYWQAPLAGGRIRLARNAVLFAHWTYWMGVTLYGFLEAASYFDTKEWKEYALASVAQITAHDPYGLWDKEHYHYPLINTQFYWLDELDDCGSFGNLMLESLRYQEDEEALKIARRIADFMKNKVLRQPDKAFYRGNDTMWTDDLYMSAPFLVRYWQLSRKECYLEEAVRQFHLYKKRFFLPEKNLMSHIFDTRFHKANQIPWSRGNGWVIFSLSEVLDKLPKNHPERQELQIFYNELVTGYLKQQDDNGLWHQVLDEPDTYIESSSTAMFICAFSRGVLHGYLDRELETQVVQSVQKAWQGLIENCIDKDGNLYGVCRGSGFSFSRAYYKSLGWALNDAHGIGIVALAGVQYEKLKNYVDK